MNRLIALALPGGAEYVAELQRIFDDGDAALPVDLRLADRAQARLLQSMQPAAIVDSPGRRVPLRHSRPVKPGDALVMATSGTTGTPKGVVLTHDAIAASARATSARLGVDPAGDRWWACLPLAHVGGLSVVLRAMVMEVGCEVVEGFSEEGAAAALDRGATLTSLVPTALRRLDPAVAAGFRRIVLGGAAPPPEALPDNVVTTYGMTETGSGVVYDGRPLDGVEVRIAGPAGQVLLRGPMLLRAYRDGTDPRVDGGWLPTGDSGETGSDGRLIVRGRMGELIITGGENVWPTAVENVLVRHEAVTEAAVSGRPDPEWGQRVAAYLVVNRPVDTAVLLGDVRDLVREELAAFVAPREIIIVTSLPKTGLGKIRREALSDLAGPSASL